MTARTIVNDTVASKTIPMWEVDAEEALRYDPVRFTVPATTKPVPKKNPGGKGF